MNVASPRAADRRRALPRSRAGARRRWSCWREHDDITALVIANNLMAIGALKALASGSAGERAGGHLRSSAIDDPSGGRAGAAAAHGAGAAGARDGRRRGVWLLLERVDGGSGQTPHQEGLQVRAAGTGVLRHGGLAAFPILAAHADDRSRRRSSRPTTSAASTARRSTGTSPSRSGARSPACSPTVRGSARANCGWPGARHAPDRAGARGRYSDGMRRRGRDVLDAGMVGTEMLYFLVGSRELDGGLMCTASHNPKAVHGREARARGRAGAVR